MPCLSGQAVICTTVHLQNEVAFQFLFTWMCFTPRSVYLWLFSRLDRIWFPKILYEHIVWAHTVSMTLITTMDTLVDLKTPEQPLVFRHSAWGIQPSASRGSQMNMQLTFTNNRARMFRILLVCIPIALPKTSEEFNSAHYNPLRNLPHMRNSL